MQNKTDAQGTSQTRQATSAKDWKARVVTHKKDLESRSVSSPVETTLDDQITEKLEVGARGRGAEARRTAGTP